MASSSLERQEACDAGVMPPPIQNKATVDVHPQAATEHVRSCSTRPIVLRPRHVIILADDAYSSNRCAWPPGLRPTLRRSRIDRDAILPFEDLLRHWLACAARHCRPTLAGARRRRAPPIRPIETARPPLSDPLPTAPTNP